MPLQLTIYTKEELRPTVCEELGKQGLAFLIGADNIKGLYTTRTVDPRATDLTHLPKLPYQRLYMGLTQGAVVHIKNLAQRGSQARISYEEMTDVLDRELLLKHK